MMLNLLKTAEDSLNDALKQLDVSDENYVFQNISKNVDYIVSNEILEECVKQIENIYKWHA